MAQNSGLREVVQDPLAQRQVQSAPQAQQTSIQRPAMPSLGGYQGQNEQLSAAFTGLDGLLANQIQKAQDEAIVRGKEMYMSGVAEHEALKSGNRYTAAGYQQLQMRDEVNTWYLTKQAELATSGATMDPQTYQSRMADERKAFLDGITDPYAKKVAVAALEQYSPALAKDQFEANNAYNKQQRRNAFGNALRSGSTASLTKSTRDDSVGFNISPTPVAPVMESTARDRDIAIRTMIGEAGNEGDQGLAGVAHVLRNRATDGRWPKSIAGVALQDNQFSAWNKTSKAGGLKIVHTLKPGSAAYERAGRIYDAVMSGKHIDPTNGATHYYAPQGMKKLVKDGYQKNLVPSWWGQESAKGSVQLGNHLFAGKSSGKYANAPIQVQTQFPDDPDPNGGRFDPVEGAPTTTSGPTNAKAAGGTYGRDAAKLTGGSAAYFDEKTQKMVNPDEPEGKTNFAERWDAGAVKADSTMGRMTEATNEQAQQNEDITPIKHVGGKNEVLEMLENDTSLPIQERGDIAADQIIVQLDTDSDQLFQDIGGVATLYKMGVPSEKIDKVLKAKERYDSKQEKKFSSAKEEWRSDVLKRANDPNTNIKELVSEIDAAVQTRDLTDIEATALTRQVLEQDRNLNKQREKAVNDPAFLRAQAVFFKQMKSGVYDDNYEAAQERAQDIADEFDLTAEEVATLLQKTFDLDQGRADTLRSEAKSGHEKALKNERSIDEVDTAIANGSGLSNLTGTVDANGKQMTKQEYGIEKIKAAAMAKVEKMVASKEISEGETLPTLYGDVYRTLQKHDVVDKELQSQLIAATTGEIMSTDADGKQKVDQKAIQAYDTYQMLSRDPNITPAYLAKLVGDEYTRLTLEMAKDFDVGGVGSVEALVKAKAQMDKEVKDPTVKFNSDKVFLNQLSAGRSDAVKELTRSEQMMWQVGPVVSYSQERIQREYGEQIDRYLTHRANVYRLDFPNASATAAMTAAKADFVNNHRYVVGSLVRTENFKLEDRMGLGDVGASAPDKAMSHYLNTHGDKLFQGMFAQDKDQWSISKFFTGDRGTSWNNMKYEESYGGRNNMPIAIDYNPAMNNFTVTLYNDNGVPHPQPMIISAKVIGDEYKESLKTTGTAQSIMDGIFKGLGQGLRKVTDWQDGK